MAARRAPPCAGARGPSARGACPRAAWPGRRSRSVACIFGQGPCEPAPARARAYSARVAAHARRPACTCPHAQPPPRRTHMRAAAWKDTWVCVGVGLGRLCHAGATVAVGLALRGWVGGIRPVTHRRLPITKAPNCSSGPPRGAAAVHTEIRRFQDRPSPTLLLARGAGRKRFGGPKGGGRNQGNACASDVLTARGLLLWFSGPPPGW